MSGRRWIFTLLAAVPMSVSGCQIDGGAAKLWNPFAHKDESDAMDDAQLPKFVRRVTDDEEKSKKVDAPIAESRVESLHAEGQRALQENRLSDARRTYQEVLQFLPDDPTAHHGMAMAADLTEDWAEAEDHYRKALRSRPRDANLLCDIGYSYLLQNRYSEASSYLSQAIQINPNHENAHTNLALLDLRQGNREAARDRLIQRYGNSGKVTQILAALDSQTESRTTTGLAATAPFVPANATFEEVREIANRERIAAEQRRSTLNVPADHNMAGRTVDPARNLNGHGQIDPSYHQGTGQQPSHFAETKFDQAAPGSQPNGGNPVGNASPGIYSLNPGAPMPSAANPQLSGTLGTAFPQNPSANNQNMNPAYVGNGTPAGTTNSNQMAPQYAYPSQNPSGNLQYAQGPGLTNFNSQQPYSNNNVAVPTTNSATNSATNTTTNSGGVIAVRPTGSFQPPTSGVSYGQPFGFAQAPIESASWQSNNNSNSVTNAGISVPVNVPNGNMTGMSASNTPSQQYSNAGQNNSQVQLDGLNAGPGSLFPISQGSEIQKGQLNMSNVSPPGTNSVLNGAMYGQPVSTLPAQEWMMQQQQQIQQLNAPPHQSNQNGQGIASQNYSQPQYTGNNPAGPQYGISNGNASQSAASPPGSQAQPVNPLAAYENQLRQLDNQYNNTLQQLDRNTSAAVPRAQY